MLPFDASELARYGGLTLVARTIVEGFLSGVHRTTVQGLSAEYAGQREYQSGDEPRRIDWRAYGKTGRFFVREYEEKTNLEATIVLDASGSMRYRGQQGTSKFGYAQQVAASLAYLMLAQLDTVGLVVHDTRIRHLIAPRTGSKQLLRILRGMEELLPGGETALAPIWHELATRHLRKRGLVVLLSDCFDEPVRLAQALHHLRHRKHDVILFHILAPEEIEFPFQRSTRFKDLEAIGNEIKMDVRRLGAEYRANFETYRLDLQRRARDLRVDYHLVRTDEPVDRALGSYLARRRRG